jgi:hypothetical protein
MLGSSTSLYLHLREAFSNNRCIDCRRSDRTLQTLAYKLVPGLYYKEMQRRRSFNSSSSDTSPQQEDPSIFPGEDSISLSLEYYDRLVVNIASDPLTD